MATQNQTSGAKPTFRLFNVVGEGKSAKWIEIGAAWPHQDEEGFSVVLDAFPIGGRMAMRKITERPAEQEAANEDRPQGRNFQRNRR